jgi:hypothetical protein
MPLKTQCYDAMNPQHRASDAMNGGQSDPRGWRRVLLFSGHMVDAPGRPKPRFPAALEGAVVNAIYAEVDALGAGPGDVAITSAACGGDILFAELMLDRGVATRIYLPFDEPTFLEKSVNFANAHWPQRFHAVVARSMRFVAAETLGPLADGADPYERTNLWMLDEARQIGGDNIVLICLWDGEGGDGPGGAKHMMGAVRQDGGNVRWIDIRRIKP